MTDISRLPNRATRRKALQQSRQRRQPDVFTLRQRRIERKRDERDRAVEVIEKRGAAMSTSTGEAVTGTEGEGVLACILRYVRTMECGWHVPVVGLLLGIVIGAIWRAIR